MVALFKVSRKKKRKENTFTMTEVTKASEYGKLDYVGENSSETNDPFYVTYGP